MNFQQRKIMQRVDDGFEFPDSSAWELDGSWVEGLDYDKEKSGKGRTERESGDAH